MQDPDEFEAAGSFRDWDRWADLRKIRVPTLLLVGRHDTMDVADIEKMWKAVRRSRVSVCENGCHLSMYDDQD